MKMTQEYIAAEFKCSRQAISSWEAGKTLPDLLEFQALTLLYGISADALLFGVSNVTETSAGVLKDLMTSCRS